ncbi:DUF3180 domain-containing protein [Jatrophihabitans sp. YIM 134969]
MTLTRVRDLVVVALVFGVLAYFATRAWYLRLPALSWPPGAAVVLIAAFELALAVRLRSVIGHDPDATPMPAVTVARWVVVGRASALAGAVCTGLGAGFTAHVIAQLGDVGTAPGDLAAGLVFVVGSVALTAAGCLLERAGLVPPTDGDGPGGPRRVGGR